EGGGGAVLSGGNRLLRRFALEAYVTLTEDDALDAAITGNQLQARTQKRQVVLVGFWIEQVDACNIAFASLGSVQPCGAAHGEELGSHAALLQHSKQVVEADAVAANYDEIG